MGKVQDNSRAVKLRSRFSESGRPARDENRSISTAVLRLLDKLPEILSESPSHGVAEIEGRPPVPVLDHGDAAPTDSGLPGKRRLGPPLLLAGLLDQGDDSTGKFL